MFLNNFTPREFDKQIGDIHENDPDSEDLDVWFVLPENLLMSK
jgi:hypothetical protein